MTKYRSQATLTEVAGGATVSLIDTATGNTVSSSVTDASGNFVLTFNNFSPVTGASYTLEAIKGLAVGGQPNRPGAGAAAIRSLLFWNGGWQSLTNSIVNTGIVVSPGTTALAVVAGLKQKAGVSLTLSALVNTISGSIFAEPGTGLSNANDFQPVLALVSNALTLDQDPVGAIGFHLGSGIYALATGTPRVASFSPLIPTPGGTVTLRGANFDPNPGRNTFWFGNIAAATWSVSVDRTTATVTVPAAAYSAPFTLEQPGGVTESIDPFLFLHGTVGTIAGSGISGFLDGPRLAARFSAFHGVGVDALGNVYVADYNNYRVRKIARDGTVSTLAGDGTTGSVDGVGTTAKISGPHGVTADSVGNIYVAENQGDKVRKIAPNGTVTTVAGSGIAGGTDGVGTAAQFSGPHDVEPDPSGNLYVTEGSPGRIRKITPAGVVSTLAGSGVAGFADGTGTAAQFSGNWDAALGPDGNLYVGDYSNHRIRKVTPAGVVTTYAGTGVAGVADGSAGTAQFNYPYGVAVDSGGNVYVVHHNDSRIRKISTAGVVSTVAGAGVVGYLDGPAASARFSADTHPAAMDTAGNLYISDMTNYRVRVYTP